MKRVLVVADDITGADDIGVMYYKSGHAAVLYPYYESASAGFCHAEKLVVDTDSRFVEPKEAYRRVHEVVRRHAGQGVQQYFSKQCSVFRGNIGSEFDAMLDATGEAFAPVVLGFPDNGRTTLHGIHYVHGELLENSQFRNDPVNPMHQSGLVDILAAQTQRPVCSVGYEAYTNEDALRTVLEEKRAAGGYAIFDVRHNEDLKLLARVLKNEKVLCGSSAIAYYLGLEEESSTAPAAALHSRAGPVLCVVGSLTPQTTAQVSFAQGKGVPVLTLDTVSLFTPGAQDAQQADIARRYCAFAEKSSMVILQSARGEAFVAATKRAAAKAGLNSVAAAIRISKALAALTGKIAQEGSVQNFIVLGGDTSSAFCRQFGIAGMLVGPEIEPGVSVCLSEKDPAMRFVLKSGSFGSDAFLLKAAQALLGENG